MGVDSGTTAGIELCSATLHSLAYIDFTCVGTDYKGRILYDIGTGSMYFQTELIERMRLTANAASQVLLFIRTTPSSTESSLLETLWEDLRHFTSMVRHILQAEWTWEPVSFT